MPLSRRMWLGCLAGVGTGSGQSAATRYLTWDEVKEFAPQFQPALKPREWPGFVRQLDGEIRARAQRGVEDSVSQLLLYGTSHTLLPRLRGPEAAISADGNLTASAMGRLKALASALADDSKLDRLRLAQTALGLQGKPQDVIERTLSANLVRFLKEEGQSEAQRGLSPDARLLPNFGVEEALRSLSLTNPPKVRRIAVIGPGLDAVDRRYGYDFYPLQTLQPYAVLEAAVRTKLGRLDEIQLVAFDLNPGVLDLIRRVANDGRAGRPRLLALLNDPQTFTPPLMRYWNEFGNIVGSPVNDWLGRKAPPGLELRTVAIRPQMAARVAAEDLNIVTQTQAPSFDLVVATNLLNFYDRWRQSLALCSVANLLAAGGIFVTNTALNGSVSPALRMVGRHRVVYSNAGDAADEFLIYQRQ